MLTTEDKVEKAIAFISGDLLSMVIVWIHFDAASIAIKVIAAGGLGTVGGFAGLLGKDLYQYSKNRLKQWRSKRKE